LVPGFWDSLIINHQHSIIFSIDKVNNEIKDYGDELSDWVSRSMPSTCFIATNISPIVSFYGDMQRWAILNTQFTSAAKAEFAEERNADCWLVACAKHNDWTLVTEEKLNLSKKNKVLIPNVCKTFGVRYLDTFAMLKELGVKLILDGKK